MQRVVTVAVRVLVAAAGAAVGRLALPRTGLRGHYFTNLTRYFTFLPAVAQSPQDRYRLPVDAVLFILAAFGLRTLVSRLFVRRE